MVKRATLLYAALRQYERGSAQQAYLRRVGLTDLEHPWPEYASCSTVRHNGLSQERTDPNQEKEIPARELHEPTRREELSVIVAYTAFDDFQALSVTLRNLSVVSLLETLASHQMGLRAAVRTAHSSQHK